MPHSTEAVSISHATMPAERERYHQSLRIHAALHSVWEASRSAGVEVVVPSSVVTIPSRSWRSR